MESHNIARTKEGHAAQAGVDKWILIQENTFRNWVNEQLRPGGMEVISLDSEFDDGVKLCLLIQSLQGKRIRVIKNPKNHHQQLANVTEALQAIANDNIKLVNIGPEDIVNGNLKLILGLIWHLILRYQIGKSKFPTKKLMLAWLQAVIPEYKINNFTSDWNDGIALNALIEFCKPGLCPDWRNLSRSDGFNNCRAAMTLAKAHFDIPLVVRPEDLSSSDLDELSGMTYLSYFMKLDSPGYNMTLTLVKRLVRNQGISNFTTAWSDGRLMCALVTSVGGHIPGWPSVGGDNIQVMQLALDAARVLHIEPILGAKELCDPEVDHIGIMAYVAYFLKFKPTMAPAEKVVFSNIPAKSYVGKEASFSITLADDDVSPGDIRAEVTGADSTHKVHFNWAGRSGQGYFTASETGLHKLMIFCEGQVINGCPASFKVLADPSKVTFTTVDMCSIGASTEFKVNSAAAGDGEVAVKAKSPSGRSLNLSTMPRQGGNYVSNFNPSEVGEWEISVLYDNQHISGSPYIVNVFDPSLVKVFGLEGGNMADGINFNADATRAGRGNVRAEVMYGRTDVTEHMRLREDQAGFYKMNFTPPQPGLYKVHMYFNDVEIRGSPYDLDIVDSSNITVSGNGLSLVPVNRTASFVIHGVSGSGKLDVEIIAPNSASVPAKIKSIGGTDHQVDFVPTVVGDHKVMVSYGGKKIQGSPYTVRVYDTGRVAVSNMPSSGLLGQPVVFDIDASKAGSGNIEIMINGGEIACSVQNHGNYRFTASFLPVSMEYHTIEMKFNKEHVPGSPWRIAIADAKSMTVSGRGLEYVQVNKTASFSIIMNNLDPKQLAVSILDPHRNSVQHKLKTKNNEMKVKYTPMEIGDYTITLKYGEQELTGSPFVAKAYNTTAIKVTDIPDGVVGQPIEFGIDVRKAGEGQLEIMVNSGTLPNTVESQETGVYKMSFTPEEAGQQKVEIIFNQEQHPDSPFTCNAVSLTAVQVRSFELQLPVDKSASFYLDLERALDVNVDIISPSKRDVAVNYTQEKDGVQRIDFIPKEVGVHMVSVTYRGAHMAGSPYSFKTWDPKLVRLSKMPLGILNSPFKFRVLGEEAGDGTMEVTVTTDGEKIPTQLEALGEGTFEVTFMGEGERRHELSILFNGEHIPSSPLSINFADMDKIRVQRPERSLYPCHHWVNLHMTCAPSAIEDLAIHIIGPVYNRVPFKLRNIGDRLYSIDWIPIKPGTYDVEVKYGDVIPAWGCPMRIEAFDSTKVKVTGHWDEPKVGTRHLMKVDVNSAGPGDLHVVIMNSEGTVQSAIEKAMDDLLHLTFDLEKPDLYDIYISYNGVPVPGSPFKISLKEDSSRALALPSYTRYFLVQDIQWCFLQSLGYYLPLDQITMFITAPTGDNVKAKVSSQGSGYKVEWKPKVAGRHIINIQYGGMQIPGSPFYVDVFDLASIRVDNFRQGTVGDEAGFSVDFSGAGMLEQEVQIVGPSGVDVVYDTRELGHLWRDYIYEAEEPGRYQIYVRYAGFELPGCPFTQEIADGGMPSASGSGLFFAEQDKPAQFIVDVGRRKGDLRVSVNGPTSVGRCTVDPNTDGSYTVTYVPVETGIFNVNLSWNGTDIPGSPYHPKVVDVRKVRVIGGWQHFMDSNERVNLVVGERKQLPFDIAEAGPGTLRAEVKGPSGSLHASVDNHTMGKSVVEFIPEEEGSHYIHLFWSDLPLVNSPFHGYAIQQVPDASKLILTGRGLKEATVREEAEFVIDGSQAGKGSPDVVLSGVRDEVNVRVSPLGNGKFRCNYVATVPGAYLLHITWNGRQLRGSPYKVNVIGAFYPNRVVVSGEGLRGGILGQRIDVVIDTRKAGPGELTAHCMGPHQVAFCELADSKDGTFNLGIKAQESGRHVLQIKYGGEHVEGSPFTFKVNSRPDASKVRVHGPGVENGILATYVSKFIVETKGAGAGQLTVRIRGPKGAFQVEMYRDSQRDRTIVCRFDPTECGLYIIQVRWSNVDVPGSPFNVHILDTTEELEQVLNENSYSIGTPRSQSSYGNRPATRMVHQGGSLPAPRTQYGQWRGQVYPGQ